MLLFLFTLVIFPFADTNNLLFTFVASIAHQKLLNLHLVLYSFIIYKVSQVRPRTIAILLRVLHCFPHQLLQRSLCLLLLLLSLLIIEHGFIYKCQLNYYIVGTVQNTFSFKNWNFKVIYKINYIICQIDSIQQTSVRQKRMKNRIIRNPLVFVYSVSNPLKSVQDHLQNNQKLDASKKLALNTYLQTIIKEKNIVFNQKQSKKTKKTRYTSLKASKHISFFQSARKFKQKSKNSLTLQPGKKKDSATINIEQTSNKVSSPMNTLWNKIKQSPSRNSFLKREKNNSMNKVRHHILYDKCFQYNKGQRTLKQIDSRIISNNATEMKTNQDFQAQKDKNIEQTQSGNLNTQTPSIRYRNHHFDTYKTIQNAGYSTSQDYYRNTFIEKEARHSVSIKNSRKNSKYGRYSQNSNFENAQNEQSISICLWQPCKISSIVLGRRPYTKQISKFAKKIGDMALQEQNLDFQRQNKTYSPMTKNKTINSRKTPIRQIYHTRESKQIIQPWKHSIEIIQT